MNPNPRGQKTIPESNPPAARPDTTNPEPSIVWRSREEWANNGRSLSHPGHLSVHIRPNPDDLDLSTITVNAHTWYRRYRAHNFATRAAARQAAEAIIHESLRVEDELDPDTITHIITGD